ncbi:MAG: hypothetical protein J5569_05895 [Oscillospiraceae bacterium]|nr:hypothetical protein [Oscillospiraceae bacterium]
MDIRATFTGASRLERLLVGFPEPENGVSSAVIYIPEGDDIKNDTAVSRIRDMYMACVLDTGPEISFDFDRYDGLFDVLTTIRDKVLVATDRLKSAIRLKQENREKYIRYLRSNAEKAVEVVVEFDDLSGLNTLAELGVFTGRNIDQVIDLANRSEQAEILSYLMNYKNTKIGIFDTDYDL